MYNSYFSLIVVAGIKEVVMNIKILQGFFFFIFFAGMTDAYAGRYGYLPIYEDIDEKIDDYCFNSHQWWADRAFGVNDADTKEYKRITIQRRGELLNVFNKMVLSCNKYGSGKSRYNTDYDAGYIKSWQRKLIRCQAYDQPNPHFSRLLGKLRYFTRFNNVRLVGVKEWLRITDLSNVYRYQSDDILGAYMLLNGYWGLRKTIGKVENYNRIRCADDYCN